eukprot:COSAG05_NODE_1319_length_5194_cov_20.004534_5_plen_100_part_00
MDMQEAIEAPRVSLPYETQGIDHPSALTVNVEGRIEESVMAALAERGHVINKKAAWDPFFGEYRHCVVLHTYIVCTVGLVGWLVETIAAVVCFLICHDS